MDLLIGDIFSNGARAVPNRMAAAMGPEALTFAQVDRMANRVARAARRLGIRPGDCVVVWSATSLDAVPLFAALAKLGAVFAPVNANLGPSEALELISSARPSLLVADEARAGPAGEVAEALGIAWATLSGLAERAAGEEAAPVVAAGGVSERDPHVLFFTSGSTGRAKGVVLSHRVNFLRTHPGAQLEPRGVMVCPYPLFHMGAWTIALQQWQARDGVVFVDSADAATICGAVARHRAERLNCIPAVWRRVLDHVASPGGNRDDLSSIRFADTGTSSTPPDLLESLVDAMPGACVRVFYGSTESGNVASLEHADLLRKPHSCGVPSQLVDVRVDEGGELLVRGPLLFDGYFGDPDATAEALVDGWYRTGDTAEVDDEGYLTITGRVGDVIRTGGESVSPSEVERALADHPGIADVAVVGIPDGHWGEIVCAAVVARPGPLLTVEQLRAHCSGRLAAFKHPRRLVGVTAIPRTPSTNQIQRRILVERIVAGGDG
jgi:fatty-acyl-CoA synthase